MIGNVSCTTPLDKTRPALAHAGHPRLGYNQSKISLQTKPSYFAWFYLSESILFNGLRQIRIDFLALMALAVDPQLAQVIWKYANLGVMAGLDPHPRMTRLSTQRQRYLRAISNLDNIIIALIA
jgi:hypothetical protein